MIQTDQKIVVIFERVMDEMLLRVFYQNDGKTLKRGIKPSIAVAYSGGADSSVLLHLAKQYAKRKGFGLYAFHVHHGLNEKANEWLNHCLQVALKENIAFEAVRVKVTGEDGIENDARNKRYDALGRLCREHDIPVLLTAHHQNDQIETVLLHLFRGSGIAGLTGMGHFTRTQLLGEGVSLARPLLAVSKDTISQWIAENNISHINDDSNNDTQFKRNAIRHQLLPLMESLFPGVENRIAHTVQQVTSLKAMADEIARLDFEQARVNEKDFNIEKLNDLSADRFDNFLRYWFEYNQIRVPSRRWFEEAKGQMFQTSNDGAMAIEIENRVIRKYRNVIFTQDSTEQQHRGFEPYAFKWDGSPTVDLPDWGGQLIFMPTDDVGYDEVWLKMQPLIAHPYQGNASLKLTNRPTKSLKSLYQEVNVPSWERVLLPLVFAGKELIYAPYLPMPAKCEKKVGNRVLIRWRKLG